MGQHLWFWHGAQGTALIPAACPRLEPELTFVTICPMLEAALDPAWRTQHMVAELEDNELEP